MKYLGILLLVVASGCTSTFNQAMTTMAEIRPQPEGALVAADLRFLAADELLGRRAGTPQAEIAARYIAEQFRAAGVEPVPGAEDGYFQTVPLPNGGTSRNVVGLIPGAYPALSDEVVVLTAHYDGLGASMGQRGATPADSIFNGARDNGMGVASLLAAARNLAESPASRTVLLFATAAEEMGLVGSRHYVDNPLVPLRETVFVLNTDGGGYSDTTVVALIGRDRTSVGPLVEAGADAAGLGVVNDPAPEAGLFMRSDNASFAVRGVPTATVAPGARAFSDVGVADKYHQPADGPDDIDYDYLARFATAFVEIARRVADAPERVTWTAGDEYESVARELYR